MIFPEKFLLKKLEESVEIAQSIAKNIVDNAIQGEEEFVIEVETSTWQIKAILDTLGKMGCKAYSQPLDDSTRRHLIRVNFAEFDWSGERWLD